MDLTESNRQAYLTLCMGWGISREVAEAAIGGDINAISAVQRAAKESELSVSLDALNGYMGMQVDELSVRGRGF